ncbi:MAG: hypothetical protein IPM97_04010 [Bdellovibrionaceae bacterium]|nr:hypothetical protein [Pseudobdellovibrionaceae bacterium]
MSIATRLTSIATAFSILLAGCSNDWYTNGANPEDSGQAAWGLESAAGRINGQPWEFVGGRGYVVRRGTQHYLIIRLWNERPADPCNEWLGSARQVRISSPNRIDRWVITPQDPFNSSHAIFFSDRDFKFGPLDNLKSDQGELILDEITKTSVAGRFRSSFENPKVGKTDVQGSFWVPLCDNKFGL